MYKIKRFSIQKEFTRAERAAFRELIRKSSHYGGSIYALPRTENARDVVRYNKLAIDLRNLSRGDKKGFDRENAKTLLNNAGLPQLANQVDHIVDKYTNKRALARLARLKSRNINYGNNEQFDLKNTNKRLRKIGRKGLRQGSWGFDGIISYQDRIKSNPKIKNELIKESHRLGVPVSRLSPFGNNRSLNPYNSSFIRSELTLPNGNKHKRVGIMLGDYANDGVLAHEIGHARSYLSRYSVERNLPTRTVSINRYDNGGKYFLSEKNDLFQKAADHIATLAEENSGNGYGQALLNKVHRKTRIPQPTEPGTRYVNLASYNKANYTGGAINDMIKDMTLSNSMIYE
jgi:hypothetical protein